MKAYKIITGDDPDQYMSEETVAKKPGTKARPSQKNEVQKNDTQPTVINYRQSLIDYCKKNGINMTDVAKKYKLSPKSTQEAFKKVLIQIIDERAMDMEQGFMNEFLNG